MLRIVLVQTPKSLVVSEFLIENNLKSTTHLFAKANEQKRAGKTDLANFVLSRSSKALNDLIDNTWAMETASETTDRVRGAAKGDCALGCDDQWLVMAKQVLRSNRHHEIVFATALRELFEKGRGKHRISSSLGLPIVAKPFF